MNALASQGVGILFCSFFLSFFVFVVSYDTASVHLKLFYIHDIFFILVPGPLPVQPSSNFFMTCLFLAFIFLMYIIRPRSLRRASLRSNVAKNRGDISVSEAFMSNKVIYLTFNIEYSLHNNYQ